VFYPITALPEALQAALYWLPLVHAIQLVRPLMAGLPVTNVGLHVVVLAAYGVAGYLVALWLIRRRLRV
jgi:lipooligosaccharide transport system permease protein